MGIAVGLVGYYSLTDVFAQRGQRVALAELPAAIASGVPHTHAAPGLDFDRWEAEDVAWWKDLKAGDTFGRIVVDAMGLDAAIIKGVGRAQLAKGPGWIPTTDLPGPTGNCVISGHRTTFGAPFRRLDRVGVGDRIRVYSPYRVYIYEVESVKIVRPTDVAVADSTRTPTITLTACHPLYSARYRLVVQAQLISVSRIIQ